MKRTVLSIALMSMANWAAAAPVDVPDGNGGVWVMHLQPVGATNEAPDAPMPVPTAPVDMPEATDVPAPADMPVVTPAKPKTVTAAKPVTAKKPVPPAPASAVKTTAPIVESFGMSIIPQGREVAGDVARRYREIYGSIPFNRAEYVANPSYRHDATMALLTGQPLPAGGRTGRTTKGRQYTPYRPYLPSSSDYYRYRYPVGYNMFRFNRLPLATIGY